jgi:transposase
MEATGTYGDALALYLHDAGHIVSIVNPARIKGFAQSELLRTKSSSLPLPSKCKFQVVTVYLT